MRRLKTDKLTDMECRLQGLLLDAGTGLPNTFKLSVKEVQVLSYVRDGAPNKVIDRKMEITEATVKVHMKAILRKIGVSNRTQAAMWASQRLPRCGESALNV
jgi:two-component system nitrate/nitrite response regulator NarL